MSSVAVLPPRLPQSSFACKATQDDDSPAVIISYKCLDIAESVSNIELALLCPPMPFFLIQAAAAAADMGRSPSCSSRYRPQAVIMASESNDINH